MFDWTAGEPALSNVEGRLSPLERCPAELVVKFGPLSELRLDNFFQRHPVTD